HDDKPGKSSAPVPRAARSAPIPGLPDIGWIENSQWRNGGSDPIVYFSTSWVVPPVPSSSDSQTVFLFNGMQPDSAAHILQPVLQWGGSGAGGGNYWSITNWYADGQGGAAVTHPPIQVNPGDVLQGVMTCTGQSASGFNYQSSFIGFPSLDVAVTDVEELTWAYETLECYGSDSSTPLTQCSDYPDTPLTAMYGIQIKTGTPGSSGTDASISWAAESNFTDCGQSCQIVSNSSPGGAVYLYYRNVAPSFYFIVDKSTFGLDEVTDVISTSGGTYPNAFWLALEGFTIQQVAGATPSLSGVFDGLSGVTITANPGGVEYENSSDLYTPQRILFPYDITFQHSALAADFPASGSAPNEDPLHASIAVSGTPLSADTVFELSSGADPYFTNVDPAHNNVSYLSQELRVFSTTNGGTPLAGGPTLTSNDPYTFIQNMIGHLNSTGSFTTPGSSDPLNNLPGQTGYETGDSSVTPLVGLSKNYNFAIARVRLRDAAGASAPNVRVFFRLWVAQSFDTDFQPSTTYNSTLGSSGADNGKPVFPLASGSGLTDPSGYTLQTVPFFATGASGAHDYDNSTMNGNIRPITIPMGQDQVWAYFGCFLDVYNSMNQSIFPGTHHCIVAQIAYDDAPIVNSNGVTMSPENSDKLAQRNLQITSSGNPNYPETHRVPQAFDMRPSLPISTQKGSLLNYPDELMIDWGNTPVGSVASIFWPQITVSEVISMAKKLYGHSVFTATDANTLQATVTKGVTYIPIPTGTGKQFGGLITVTLPDTVRVGQEFRIQVRRVTSRQVVERPQQIIPAASTSKRGPKMLNWRYVTGTFQITIPVDTDHALLPAEETTLAIMKWRLQHMSPEYRWYRVVERYIQYLTGRVNGFGGNAGAIPPSLTGVPLKPVHPGGHLKQDRGRVCEVIYDCFGCVKAFVLESCCGERRVVECCEASIGELALRACRERLWLTVLIDEKLNRICEIRVSCCC
ncbi:MAG TPA: hypothetical protein VKS01_00410, partial [Bryobacteraceae bacterium]|nr:hypothetical protein [Bryobacteraceae bacterium]